jgi:5-methyltetrahydrofolate--homocysteine methyltransferase
MTDLVTALRSGPALVMDGAMGTELLRQTLAPAGECSEAYNLEQRGLVDAIHRSYLDVGADVLLTNTFQANPAALGRRHLGPRLHEIWQEALRLARPDHPRPHYVLADIGPIADLTLSMAADLLGECVGVDGVLLETWTSLADLNRFVDRPLKLPLLISFTFHRTNDLMTIHGVTPERCAREAERCGAAAVGANCGKEIGMSDMVEIVRRYRQACALPIFVRPNAGAPTKSGWRYPRSPETMAAALPELLDAGAAMVGGCCGTTPEHIRQFRLVVDEWNRDHKPG